MIASRASGVLVHSSRRSAIAEEVFAAAGLCVAAGAEHGHRIAQDVADVEVAAGVAFEDCSAVAADGDLTFE